MWPKADQVLPIDDDGRHRVDADLLPELLGLAHLAGELAALEHLASTLDG